MVYNTKNFITKAVKVHGNKYDYTNVVCNRSTDKVEIICKKHGPFHQQARCHIRGQECPECAKENRGNKKSNLDYFLKKINGKYTNLDYSKSEYIDCNTPICIICHELDGNGEEHGEYYQTPHNHIFNRGCPKCSNDKKKKSSHKRSSIEEFIKKARKVHGDKYDYSKAKYVTNNLEVCIICPEHGEFWQTPSAHLKGQGCNKCSKKVYNTESFIKRSIEIHGNKYDYSKVNYIDSITPVCIICPIHGEFWVTPANFNNVSSNINECPKCQREKLTNSLKHTVEEFIRRSIIVHGNKYDYSKVEYVNNHTKVCIICPEHGEFWQTPQKHLSGHGCPKCNASHLEREVMLALDEHGIKYTREYSCKWSHKKRYDFLIDNTNILIECQGEQHYIPVDFANNGNAWAEKLFKKNQKNDELKKKYADDNGFKILYYTNLEYSKFNEIRDIDELIKRIEYETGDHKRP